ncbi:helix-turn-helix transcriptional regulator [Thalassotalea atypica]|uniref:helix-turn-helix transcriptional regulator n=1 Tax=Thalassotalea atypica TaxID=2054316 RepID=UPI0025733EAA|nr:AraC family transcriptional regulator [Thalassotalea atypica]
MDSFFFNITDRCYKLTELYKHCNQHIYRVDISNGLVFFDISLNMTENKVLRLKNLDRMNFIVSVRQGACLVKDNIAQKDVKLNRDNTYLFGSSRQDLEITIEHSEKSEIFILFIGDFFIKRYLSDNTDEPINFLYEKLQTEVSLELINETPTDALSLYLIDKIIKAKHNEKMNSIISEHRAIEYIIHRFSLLDILDPSVHTEEEVEIAARAKNIILQHYCNPPSLKELARLCATNDFKLKKSFKKVHKTTIYAYIQKLRLERANLLLRENIMSVADIAHEIGYKHQGHFSSIFYKAYGVYPKDLKSSAL